MTVRFKQIVQAEQHQPRFDFASNSSDHRPTATIKELLIELNNKKRNDWIADYDLKSLRTTLRFVSSISTFEKPKRVGKAFSISTIKTIKLLFQSSQLIHSHLIRLIELPGGNTPASMDFFTSPINPESEVVERQIIHMISTLEKEIDKDEIASIEEICDPARLRDEFRKDTNEAIDKILLDHIHIDDDLMELADVYLAEKTRKFLKSVTPLKREPRLHVATNTYLKLLDYVHNLHFEVSTQLKIPNDSGVANKRIDFTEICKKVSASEQRPIAMETNFMAIGDVAGFVDAYPSDIAQMVLNATGFKYAKRDVPLDCMRASMSLVLYLAAADLPNENNEKPIGIVHIVAAYCSVLHQRKLKSKPEKNSKKYGTKLIAPQKILDSYLSRRSTHIPWTVQFKYRERTKWYVHALLGRKHKADSHIAVQIAQAELTRDVFMSLDHVQIREHVIAYRRFMEEAAHEFITLHNRQDTIYEWKHGH